MHALPLVLAGIYNLIFGAWVVLWPSSIFSWLGMRRHVPVPVAVHRHDRRCHGIGYLAASRDPIRHWPIVLVGFLGKIFGPIGFLQTAMVGDIPWSFGFVIIFNDLIWWIPFGAILLNTWRSRTSAATA